MTVNMKLKDIGEFGLIGRIARATKMGASVVRGIGDDAAALKWMRDEYLLATVDMLIEDRHFRRFAPAWKIGWKALCCGISDIAAMGGVPKWALVSCGLPKELSVKYVDGIYAGMKKAARKFGIDIVGGDTNASDKIILDVTVLGEAKRGHLTLRSGAKAGDYIFVTGELGGSIYGKHLDFTPRLKESRVLVRNFRINSMIDLSDGLSSDLGHILRQSDVGAVIYECLIPKSKYAKTIESALSDGEDFELLFTMPRREGLRLLAQKNRLFNIPVTRIGTVTHKKFGAKILDILGRKKDLAPKGFAHF
jgi:thiamine-monophosphate kinase